ncbi:hypothetical protein ACH5RR_038689 [Cinchona calisaya]|uniref:Uncharacterized protein n=1 Tax=Cinchona calisaya TaxID=153742 RepID=A0ABD2XW12_9GENT
MKGHKRKRIDWNGSSTSRKPRPAQSGSPEDDDNSEDDNPEERVTTLPRLCLITKSQTSYRKRKTQSVTMTDRMMGTSFRQRLRRSWCLAKKSMRQSSKIETQSGKELFSNLEAKKEEFPID